jgi:threonine/homoserine efflux transporter RhtA
MLMSSVPAVVGAGAAGAAGAAMMFALFIDSEDKLTGLVGAGAELGEGSVAGAVVLEPVGAAAALSADSPAWLCFTILKIDDMI